MSRFLIFKFFKKIEKNSLFLLKRDDEWVKSDEFEHVLNVDVP